MSTRGWVLFGTMCVLWGIPYMLIKVAVEDVSPATLVFLRTGLAALLLVPLALARGEVAALLPRWRTVAVYTAVEVAVPWLLLSDAERRLSSSLAGLLIATVPLLSAVLARVTGAEGRLGLQRLAGLVAGMVGVGVLLGLDVGGGDLWPVLEIGGCAVGYSIGPQIISRRMQDLPSLGVVAASLGLSAVAYAPVALTGLPASMPSARVLAAVAALAVVCTAVAFLVFFALIAEVGPVRAMVFAYVNPAVAVALGVAVLGEHFTVATGAGFVLILGGSVLATGRGVRTRARRGATTHQVELEEAVVGPISGP